MTLDQVFLPWAMIIVLFSVTSDQVLSTVNFKFVPSSRKQYKTPVPRLAASRSIIFHIHLTPKMLLSR